MAIAQSGLEKNQGLQAVKGGRGLVFFGGRNERRLRISKRRVEGVLEVDRHNVKKDWSAFDFVLCSVAHNRERFSNGGVQTGALDRWHEMQLEDNRPEHSEVNRGEEPVGAEKKFGEIWGKPRRNAVSSMGKEG